MKKEYSMEELLHKAASYCSLSEHSISDVDSKLKSWEVSEKHREQIIERLIKDDFINEKRFADAYARDKFRFNKWGKLKISMGLKAKALTTDVIDEALSIIDDEEYASILHSLLKSKLKTIKYSSDYEMKGKLFRFAQSRGFESNIIEKTLRTLTN